MLSRTTFPVSNGNNIVSCNFARFAANDVNADKLPLETEPVARDNLKTSPRLTQFIIVVCTSLTLSLLPFILVFFLSDLYAAIFQ